MAREYDETRVCLKVDSKTGEMTKKQDMPEGGSAFGISCIGKYIYVIGGTQQNKEQQVNAKFDICTGSWTKLPKTCEI